LEKACSMSDPSVNIVHMTAKKKSGYHESQIFEATTPKQYFATKHGKMLLGDSIEVMETMQDSSVDLIMTSPPFALVRKKDYGNEDATSYLDWFCSFAKQFYRILKNTGSLVIDIGGSWIPGTPTRSLYHFKLLIMLCEEYGFNLAQEFYWWNPSKLPTPAEWVTVRRLRAKDAINTVWWLSKTPWPKADNRRVLQPYSDSMKHILKNGYQAKKRPSGHEISNKFGINNGASIPANILAVPNTESNSYYQRYCRENGIKPHPARFPSEIPEFFIRLTTDEGDTVIDPFGGSCVTGEVCERLERNWVCIEVNEEYLKGGLARFSCNNASKKCSSADHYKIARPGVLWNGKTEGQLPLDGGQSRPKRCRTSRVSLIQKKKF